MWRSFWRSIDRFSLQHFKYVINELRAIKVVDLRNRELVIDLLQSIVEIVTYGDRQDPMIFECFMEYQVLAEFVRLLKISKNSRIEAPLLQYLSIMIQNMDSEHAIYYCFSNDYVNNIIAHKYEFDGGDLAPYYVSFLRAVSSKINKDTLCLLVKVQEDAVVSFPLYSEALKFAHYEEKMIQTAVRALTLNIYNVSDDIVFKFITTPPVSKYFSDVVCRLRKQCLHLDTFLQAKEEMCTHGRRNELILETDKIVDDLYYLKDILSVSENRLGRFITQNLFSLLVFPILLPLLQLRQQIDGSNISEVTSLYIISRLIQVIGGKRVINAVAGVILYPYMTSSVGGATEGDTVDVNGNSFLNHLNDVEKLVCSGPEMEGSENTSNYMFGHLAEHVSSDSQFVGGARNDICIERGGIFKYVFADNSPSLLLASLFLLLILAESKDLDYFLFPMIGRIQDMTTQARELSASQRVDESIFVKFMPQILNALLKILASQPPLSVLIQWHTGWFFRKLLISQGNSLSDLNFQLFNTSYEQSRERLRKELDGCWFDRIPDTFQSEWSNCRTALEESSQFKDPFFALELAVCREKTDGDAATLSALQRMVEAVKVFILHLQLKAFIFKGDLPEKPTLNTTTGPTADSGRSHTSDISSASFGSDVSLGSGIPCSIAFSNAGIRDVYLVPAARGITGKLLLTEKHPFRSQRGVVIAIAPLAGLSPKIDKDHPSWLHLQIREFDPRFDTSKARGNRLKMSNHVADGRWTLGFPNAKACETARLLILEETGKQRSFVERMLAPLLQDDFLGNLSDNQDE
ncbi:protein TRANSPARENT TESTA 9-like isoform X1 [Juglans microcarpa x Juglans regia]|uniref:protein TRANSPARENT TESTA 9-like isoform X1 n=1 Tax=Juglans microcarpa x Juglans regia TaxID=2249226 RepID=UPI001B7E56DA|nr:protein TRANSPARENT TESTA 9-like isoform X1 [Juglans microcarpa x Juglans regia]